MSTRWKPLGASNEDPEGDTAALVDDLADVELALPAVPNYGGGHGHSHGGNAHGHSHAGNPLHALSHVFSLGTASSPLGRLLRLSMQERGLMFFGVIALVVATGINVIMPYSFGVVLQNAVGDDDGFGMAVRLVLLFLIVYIIGSLMTVVRVACFAIAGERIARSLRVRLYSALLQQPVTFFDNARSGELVNRLAADCELIRNTLTSTVVIMTRFGLQIAGGSVFLFYLSWSLTLVMLAVVPVLGLAGYVYSRRARVFGRDLQNALAQNTAAASEGISGVRHIRLFDMEKYEIGRYHTMLDATYELACRLGIASAIFMGATEFGTYLAVLAVLLYGTHLVLGGSLSVDFITSYILYAVYVAHALGSVSNQGAELARAAGASERVFDLLDRIESRSLARKRVGPSTTANNAEPTGPKLRGDVRFEKVVFEYAVEGKRAGTILRNLSFQITAGQSIGIVGPSGAGKSSILQLLPRLYDVTEGVIEIDGQNIVSYDPHWLRRQIGFVSQEPTLFHGTIRENILYGRLGASDEEVIEAAKSAFIHDTIMSMPQGYETSIGDRGTGLSGGQRQRIAIARVFLKNSPIILMDEPTSALDAENEALVVQAIEHLFRERTCLIVTHRSDLLRIVDKVIVIENGGLEAFGIQQTVATTSKTYQRLFAQA